MPTFGPHETGQRLFRSGVGGIYALKADEKRVIKELQPPPGIWSDERLQEEIDAFRLRAKTQRAIARTSKFWAPLYEIAAIRQGTEAPSGGGEVIEHPSSIGDPYAQRAVASGAYMVLDRYERSVQSLIDGKVNLLNADLRCLTTAIMKGLIDFSKEGAGVGGRAHGALKPTNILLKDAADLTTATVHLADPAPDGALDKNSFNTDLGNLARIIYELVNHRAYEEGTIARSADWDAIGPNGEDWRKLCIALLDPHAGADERDLDKLIPRIDTWRRKPKKSKKPALIAAAAVLLIAGGIVAYELSHPKVVYDAGRWQALNLEYHAWFGDFVKPLYVPKNLLEFRRPDFPADIAGIFDKYKDFVRYDPEQIDVNSTAWDERLTKNNGDNQVARYGDNPKYTQQGLLLMDEVTKALTPDKWPLMKTLSDTATRYEKERGWDKPAAGIRKVMIDAQPPRILDEKLPLEDAVKEYAKLPLTERIKKADDLKLTRAKSIFDGIESAVATGRAAKAAETHWTRIGAKVAALPGTAGTQDKASQITLLAGLKKFVDGFPAAQATEEVASLEVPFNQLDDMLDQLAAAFPTGRQIDFDELMTDAATKVPPSVDNYKAFAKATENYWNITKDPRDGTEWGQKLAGINDMISLIKESAAPDDKLLPGINQEYSRIGDFIRSTQGLKPILKNEKTINENSASIATALDQLESRSNEHPAYMNQSKFDAYVVLQKARSSDLQKMPASIAAVVPPVKAKWLEAQSALSNIVSKRTLAEFRKTHVADERKFAEIDAFYSDFDRTIPTNDAARVNLEKAFGTGPDWAKSLAQRVAAESRELELADLLKKAITQAENPPTANDAAYVSLRQQSLKSYETICLNAQTLISDHLTMDARLNTLHIDKSEGWRKLRDVWPDGKNALLTETPIKTIRDRVAALLATESLTDYTQVRDASLSDVPEISLAAWRVLGSVKVNDSTPYLTDEQNAEKKLSDHLAKMKSVDPNQNQVIGAEMVMAEPARWQRWADVVSSADSITQALTLAKTFNVDISRQSQPVMFYYQELLKLKGEYQKSQREADLKAPAQSFMKLMDDPALASISKTDVVVSMLKDMTKSMSTDQETSSAGKQGPQFADWDMESPNQDVRIFHSKDKKTTLEFRRMQVIENSLTDKPQKTVFLCTTEMPVGLFVQVMNTLGKIDDLDNSKAAAAHWFEIPATNYYKSGPRSWTIVGSEFAVSSRWLDEAGDPLTKDKPFYPAGAGPADPTADSPVELVTPWVAMYAARLLGCRLPTSDEWQLAYTTFEQPKPGSALPKDVWNLRGDALPGTKASWTTQQAYADAYPERLMPYPDAGIFSVLNKPAAKGTAAKPWLAADLAKLAPERISPSAGTYAHSTLWFEPVNKETSPAGSAGSNGIVMHHLVGNVGEFVFDSDEVAAPILNNTATPTLVDDSVRKARNKMFVIGGSALSPPEMPFNEKQPVNPDSVPAKRGYSDVGFRLAYTAPKETIVEVLAKLFRDPKVLPGPRGK